MADRTVSARIRSSSRVGGLTDLAYDVYGLRVQWTIFGGLDETPTPADRAKVVDRFVAAMQRRAHKVQHVEVANEGYATGWAELRDEAKQLATRIRAQTPFAVAVSAPGAIGDVASWYEGSSANLLTVHLPATWLGTATSENGATYGKRGTVAGVTPGGTNNEGKGPQSSVAADDDPLRLTMYAEGTWWRRRRVRAAHRRRLRGGGRKIVNASRREPWEVRTSNDAGGHQHAAKAPPARFAELAASQQQPQLPRLPV